MTTDALYRQAERWSEALTGAVALQAGCLVTAAVINEYRADVAASLYARQQRAWNVARARGRPCPILTAGRWAQARAVLAGEPVPARGEPPQHLSRSARADWYADPS